MGRVLKNKQLKPFCILALNTGLSIKHEQHIIEQQGLKCKPIKGVYKGVPEISFVVPYIDLLQFRAILHLAKMHKQESILICDSERNAFLHFCDDASTQDLGRFKSVHSDLAAKLDAYSYDFIEGVFYAAV